ncbi:cyclin-dependent kinase 2-interacting protein [Daphnia magna]|uniref:cyclin-dependent kinase 2-interacting protein n=1 Tax=Daphnia magna TaxID=35525 RepID=UPI001E1BCEE7|nr:cyclin-dependent kinase 2-interacting protein [Daphnia magna]XP_045034007.1 cyclin-dependent kinase 2-interacting protein [Daphnia magna]XP_045034010.1 cyclin-dependent kinase 2-interacting protein [Daphnia magna]
MLLCTTLNCNTLEMDTSFTLSNSPSPVKKSGNSQRAFELAGELYSLVQQWFLLITTGRNIINNILQLKTKLWENPGNAADLSELQFQCDQLGSAVSELEVLPKLMEKIQDQYKALEKLGELHKKIGSNITSDFTPLMFLTWPNSKFVLVVTAIKDAFNEELQLKKCIAENVAHCQQKQMLDLHKIAWVHQVYVTSATKLQLESLLVETGQR